MAFVPVEKLTEKIPNKYEAILVAAKDARVQNSIQALKDLDPNEPQPKITSVSLSRLIDGDVEYHYHEETPEEELSAEMEDAAESDD